MSVDPQHLAKIPGVVVRVCTPHGGVGGGREAGGGLGLAKLASSRFSKRL